MKPIPGNNPQPVEVEPGLFGIGLVDGANGARSVALLRGWIEPGAQHSPHTHDAEEAVVILSGTSLITIGDVQHQVVAGDAVLLPAGVVHSTYNNSNQRMEFVAAFSDALVTARPARAQSAPIAPLMLWLNRARWVLRRICNRLLR
jgi:quercetin dioxygenase-like cupin family protein